MHVVNTPLAQRELPRKRPDAWGRESRPCTVFIEFCIRLFKGNASCTMALTDNALRTGPLNKHRPRSGGLRGAGSQARNINVGIRVGGTFYPAKQDA